MCRRLSPFRHKPTVLEMRDPVGFSLLVPPPRGGQLLLPVPAIVPAIGPGPPAPQPSCAWPAPRPGHAPFPAHRMLRLPRSELPAHPPHAAPVSPPQGSPAAESRFSALSLRGAGHRLSPLSPYLTSAYLPARTSAPGRPSPLPVLSAVSLTPVTVPGIVSAQ